VGAVGLVFGAEFRRRWRAWLILVVLIAMVGGLVLAATAAGRRTADAFPRFVAAHGADFDVLTATPDPGLARLPEVASVLTASVPFNDNLHCACRRGINGVFLNFEDFSARGLSRAVQLVAGRLPAPSSPDELIASYNLQQDFGVHVGTVIRTSFFGSSQKKALLAGANLAPSGPTVTFHVVGIEAAEPEFPAGQGQEYDLYTTQAFARTYGRSMAAGTDYLIRLRHGAADLPQFGRQVNAIRTFSAQNLDAVATAVTGSIHAQAVGWWVLAVLTGLAGIAVIGQALGRQSIVESEEYPALSALGFARRPLVLLGTTRNLLVGLVGAGGAVLVAFALSPLTPVGEARLAEPSTGLAFDSAVLLLGAVAIVAIVLALGMWPSVRAARVQVGDDRVHDSRSSAIVNRAAAAGAPPSAVIGLRHALERGRGATTVPVGTALFGTALAVLALCATAVFGTSLSHLTATPALYGDDYQMLFVNNPITGGSPATEIAALKRDPAITGIMFGTRNELSIHGVSVAAVAARPIRGPLLLSTVNGHLPTAANEIVLGNTTERQVGARPGSTVFVTVQEPTGGTRTAAFHVVGTASFPGQFGLGGLGTGAALTSAGYRHAVCPPGPTQSACQRAFRANQKVGGAVMARAAPGPRGQAAVTHFLREFSSAGERPTTPVSLVNFGQAVNFPLILGFVLALFGAATLIHLLVVSVGRRRREIGLLRSIGFVNRQVGATVGWQATTVALVGIVVGVPLGIAVGQWVWRAFATNLGAVPAVVVSPWLLVLLAGGVLIAANLLAIGPAVAAQRRTAGQLLRMQ
jgi:ABC-type lipoprotein release transport system permease subunit